MLKIKDIMISLGNKYETEWHINYDSPRNLKYEVYLGRNDTRPLGQILPGIYAELLKRQGYSSEHAAKIISAPRIRNYVKNKIVGRFSQRTINKISVFMENKPASEDLPGYYQSRHGKEKGSELFFLSWLAYREKFLLNHSTFHKKCSLHPECKREN